MNGGGGAGAAEPPGGPSLSGGLADPLDEDRARSLADEGGAAGAIVEAEVTSAPLTVQRRGTSHALLWCLAGLGAGMLAAYALRRAR